MTDFRALCQELMDAIDSGIPVERIKQSPLAVRVDAALEAQPEPQGLMPEVDDILRLAAIIRRVDGNHDKGAAALAEAILSHPDSRWQHAQPEPQGPGPTDENRPMPAAIRDMPEQQQRWYALGWQAALARWGRPAIEPVPKREDVHYAWELHDAEGEWQAGGSANSLEDVQREGNRYLQTYLQDGPHKLIIERHCVTTIEPVPGVEGGDA